MAVLAMDGTGGGVEDETAARHLKSQPLRFRLLAVCVPRLASSWGQGPSKRVTESMAALGTAMSTGRLQSSERKSRWPLARLERIQGNASRWQYSWAGHVFCDPRAKVHSPTELGATTKGTGRTEVEAHRHSLGGPDTRFSATQPIARPEEVGSQGFIPGGSSPCVSGVHLLSFIPESRPSRNTWNTRRYGESAQNRKDIITFNHPIRQDPRI